jgi:hypothetical protein
LKDIPVKKHWIETARSINSYHILKLTNDEKWRLEDTARELDRSIGAVSQYLTIASWLRTSEDAIRKCDTMKEALIYIKKRHREMLLRGIR